EHLMIESMEALVYTLQVNQIWRWRLKLQWIYEKIFLFEEPLPFIFWHYYHKEEIAIADDITSKYGELHLLSKLLHVASVGQSTLTRFYSLHTFVVTCHLDTSLQLRSIFIQIVEMNFTKENKADYGSYKWNKRNFGKDNLIKAKLAKGMGHNYYGEPVWPNDLLYIFLVVILGTIACNVGLAYISDILFRANIINTLCIAESP
ncbi:hypothetical protein ACJX0J_022209, partial [Zea mays]